ncbi:Na+/H+ antiporter NhaA [Amphritea atlantica]|uniref:Na(+)/H(+) antiporter NhaA n=1 Tax=Amphritea atlantica TaxID=355243 RepID=A0ABY5GZG6_9GAMM|nr:Na+/H+ antiporter NhaA [Amphritea atlantica]
MKKIIKEFFQFEAATGILLIVAMVLAMIFANSPWSNEYYEFWRIKGEVRIGSLGLEKSLLHWVNDGLMAMFFMLVGLELKREIQGGQLSSLSQVSLPGIAAIGGMAVPALVFYLVNMDGSATDLRGWAIPTATDIAFALGILSLLGPRVPASLKLFLMALAIMDDLGAIIVIALFYTENLAANSLLIAAAAICVLILMNRMGVVRVAAYVIVGVVLWVSVLKSGVHATLAGVVLALAIPNKDTDDGESPLKSLEHALHPWVSFAIIPLFAFVNAGVDLSGISFTQLFSTVPLGILLGLFVGKQVGVFLFSWCWIKLGMAEKPQGASWLMLYGVSVLTGIGFTMSLFIDALAYEGVEDLYGAADRLAILAGSAISAVLGYLILIFAFRKEAIDENRDANRPSV